MGDRVPVDRILLAAGALAFALPEVFAGASLLRVLVAAAGLYGMLRTTSSPAPKWIALVPGVALVACNLVGELVGHRDALDALVHVATVVSLAIVVHGARAHVGRALATTTVVLLIASTLALPGRLVEDESWGLSQLAEIGDGCAIVAERCVGIGMALLALGPLLERPTPMYSTRLGVVGLVAAMAMAIVLADGEPSGGSEHLARLWMVLIAFGLAAIGMIGLVRSEAPKLVALAGVGAILGGVALVAQGNPYERSIVALPMLVYLPCVALAAGLSPKLAPRPLRRAIVVAALVAALAAGLEWMQRRYVSYASDLGSLTFVLLAVWYALLVSPPTEMPAWAFGAMPAGDPYRTAAPGAPIDAAPAPPARWPRWVALAGALIAAGAAYYHYDQSEHLSNLAMNYDSESRMTYVDGEPIDGARGYEDMAWDYRRAAGEHEMPTLAFGALSISLLITAVVLHVRHRRALAA